MPLIPEERPTSTAVWRAIEVYLVHAYPDGPPRTAEALIESLRGASDDDFYSSPVFERTPTDAPRRFSLRLGNRHYPHMKLVVEQLPGRGQWLFRADTHDAHLSAVVPESEREVFRELMERNGAIATRIEADWARDGLPTFREYLRSDLERRVAEKAARD